jgi:hypothetical protein
MDINPNKLDELFQRASVEFRPEAPEHRWPEIEKQIRRKKKRAFGFWLSIASLFLLVGGAGAWFGLAQKHSTNQQSSNNLAFTSNSTNSKSTSNTFPANHNIKSHVEQSTNENQSESSPKNIQLSQKIESKINRSELQLNQFEHSNPNDSHSEKSNSSEKNRNVKKSLNSYKISKNRKLKNQGKEFNNSISSLFSIPAISNQSNSPYESSNLEIPLAQNREVLAYLQSKMPRISVKWDFSPLNLTWKDEPVGEEKSKKNLFDQMLGPSWGFVFQPEYVNNWEQLRRNYLETKNGNIVITPVNPNFQSSLNSLNHNVGFSLAIQSRFAIDKKTSFDLGLSYGYRSDRQNYFECFNPNSGESKLYFLPLSGWSNTPQTFQNSYHYVSLPLGMTHSLTGNTQTKGLRLHWNIIPQYLVSGNSMTFDFSKDGFVTGSISQNSIYHRLGCTAGLGFGYAIKVNSRTLLETGIQWNGNWSTMFNAFYPVDKRFGAIGARFGLVFK